MISEDGQTRLGSRIGVFEIRSMLGSGGMGEVYRAWDTRLGREVAIKMLPRAFATDPARLARFDREARVLATLSHPNIAAIYGVQEADGVPALVLELVEGPTLAEWLAERSARQTLHTGLSVDEAMAIARQIADALDVAHERGIVHRDLKPANLKITPDGVVKVLDFGLAKAVAGDHSGDRPQLLSTMTMTGVVVGTSAYLSPEQARGLPVDKRTDIWAFGCVVYEMLTGRPPFRGDTVSDTLVAILEREPDLTALPVTTPPALRHVVQRCLEKDVRRRLRDIGDARIELELPMPDRPHDGDRMGADWTRARRWMLPLAAVAAAVVVTTGISLARADRPPPGMPTQLILSVEDQANASANMFPVPSPDGGSFVFAGGRVGAPVSLWVRAADAIQSTALPGTEGASGPIWSPDGRWVAFHANGKVKKISPSGGSPQTIAEAPGFVDAAWGSRGDIIFRPANRSALFRVRESGGTPEPLTTLDQSLGQNSHRGPVFLPDGLTFLFTSRCADRDNNALYLGSMDSRSITRLMPIQSVVRYIRRGNADSGALLYYRDGGLVAQHFNADTHSLSGDPVPVVDKVEYSATGLGLGFNVSQDGRVAVLRRESADQTRLTWFDRFGEPIGTVGEPGNYMQPRISPDGTRVAVTRPDARTGNRDIWQIELARGVTSRLTTNVANDWFPVWSPDGRQLLFGSDRDGGVAMPTFLKKALDAASGEARFSLADQQPLDWSRDGRWITYKIDDVLIAPTAGNAKPFPFLATPFHEGDARFSPDGKWIAYASDETGDYEVYVRPFAGGPAAADGKIQISQGGGDFPVWRGDGQELYYMSGDFTLYAVNTTRLGRLPVTPLPSRLFRACPGTLPFGPPTQGEPFAYNYDTHDGKRFLVNCTTESPGRFTVLLDWPLTPK